MRVISLSPVVAALAFLTLAGACAEPFSPPPNTVSENKAQTLTGKGSLRPEANQAKRLKPGVGPEPTR